MRNFTYHHRDTGLGFAFGVRAFHGGATAAVRCVEVLRSVQCGEVGSGFRRQPTKTAVVSASAVRRDETLGVDGTVACKGKDEVGEKGQKEKRVEFHARF